MTRGANPPITERHERRMATGRMEARHLDYGQSVSTDQDRRNTAARRKLEARREAREATDQIRWFFD